MTVRIEVSAGRFAIGRSHVTKLVDVETVFSLFQATDSTRDMDPAVVLLECQVSENLVPLGGTDPAGSAVRSDVRMAVFLFGMDGQQGDCCCRESDEQESD